MTSQFDFTSKYEGVCPWMYLDTRGHVTAGVGFLLPDLAAAQRLAWSPASAVRLDWVMVTSMKAGLPAAEYRKVTVARLDESTMRAEFGRRMAAYEGTVARSLPRYYTLPPSVRMAVLDMAWQLGPGFLVTWPKFREAVVAREWEKAAQESFRKDAQAARNEATAALLRSVV